MAPWVELAEEPLGNQNIYVTLLPQLRDVHKLHDFSRRVSEPHGDTWRAFLSRADLLSLLGVPNNRDAIVAWVTQTAPTSLVMNQSVFGVVVRGAISEVERVFGVKMKKYSRGEHTIIRTTDPPLIPRHIAEKLRGIEGIDDFPPTYLGQSSGRRDDGVRRVVDGLLLSDKVECQAEVPCCSPSEWLRRWLFAEKVVPRAIYTTWAFEASSASSASLEELDLLLEIYSVMGGSFLSAVLSTTLSGDQYPAAFAYVTAVGSTLRMPTCLGGDCASEVAVSRGGFSSSNYAWYQGEAQGRGYPDMALFASDGDAAHALGDFAARLPTGVALGP
jgi:hypothetical protein